jgi:putative sugar O-methyltransferase
MSTNVSIYETIKCSLDISPLQVLRALKRCGFRISKRWGPGALTTAQSVELQLMRRDNQAAGPPFVASRHWQEVVAFFDNIFFLEGIRNPEEQPLNLRFSGFAPGDERLHRYVCWMYRKLLQPRDSLDLLNSLKATCGTRRGHAYEMESRTLSLDLLLSIDDFYNLYEMDCKIASEPVVVGELGAGWGRLGYVLRKVNPRAVYVVFDLPEVLLISETYLPTLMHGSTFRRYSQNRLGRHNRHSLMGADLWFFGPQQMAQFDSSSIDYIVNIGSFQEMPVEDVETYIKYFCALAGGGYCYLRQLRSGSSHGHHLNEISGFDKYPFPNYWERIYLRSTMLSDEFFEVGFSIPQDANSAS